MKHRTHPPHRPWAIWFALLVAVLSALAPTPSRGWVRTADMSPVDICTSGGPHRVTLTDAPDSSGSPESSTHIEHCSLCLFATNHVVPLRDVTLQRLDGQGTVASATAGQVDPFNDHSRTRPQPRAPPRN